MRPRTLIGISAGVGAVVLALTSCGGDGDYCTLIEDAGEDLATLDQVATPGDAEMIETMASTFDEIADAAPDEVADQWNNLADAMATLAGAGADFENMDEDDLAKFASLESDTGTITDHAREQCEVDLDAG